MIAGAVSVLLSVVLIAVAVAVIVREIVSRWTQIEDALAYRDANLTISLLPAPVRRRAA